MTDPETFSADALRCVELLESIVADRALLLKLDASTRNRLVIAAGRVSRPGRDEQRHLTRQADRARREARRARHEATLATTGIRLERTRRLERSAHAAPPALAAPYAIGGERPAAQLGDGSAVERSAPYSCYVCKQDFGVLHHFYDALCPACAELNWRKRGELADLSGRVAIVTGARVKIGFEAALKLLRCGAHVVAVTRFPRDAARRYAQVADFGVWRDRLEVHGLDLRHTPSVEGFCRHMLERLARLDYLLNNACQTVRRPPGFYAHLMQAEAEGADALSAEALSVGRGQGGRGQGIEHAATLSQIPMIEGDLESGHHIFPVGQLDGDEQQVDLREVNSWRLGLSDVTSVELLEVQLVNAVAPFVLNAKLKPLMLRTPERDKHIVNVSAMEGQFYRTFKTDKHPHTNMAKAALNMMTRTSAPEYLRDGIHMNSVDTGWITDEDPVAHAERKRIEQGFHPPLDAVDAAARICDPIIAGTLSGQHVWGQFLKDYAPTPW